MKIELVAAVPWSTVLTATAVRSSVTGGNQISLEEVKGEWFIFSYFDSEKTKESD